MKTLVLAGVMLALALVLGMLMWSRESKSHQTLAERERAFAEAEGLTAPRLDTSTTPSSALEVTDTARVERSDAAPTAAAASSAVEISGRIASDGVCTDDEAEVFVTPVGRTSEWLSDWLDKGDKSSRDHVYGRSRILPDGTFQVSVPADSTLLSVHVRGRYLFSENPVAIDVRSPVLVTIATVCGACIEGRVLPPTGMEPVTDDLEIELGMSIEALAARRGAGLERKTTAKDGLFSFKGLPTKYPLEIEVALDTYPPATNSVGELQPARTTRADLQLVRGGTLRGRVVGPDGAAVTDAEVRALRPGRWFGFDDKAVREKKSAVDGTFELPAVAVGKLKLSAQKDGLIAGDPLTVQVGDGAVIDGLVITLGSGNSIEGTVTLPDGKPATDVRVSVEFDKGQMFGMNSLNAARGSGGNTRSAADGSFVVRGLGAGPFTVKAEMALGDPKLADEEEKLRARKDDVKPNTKGLALVLAAASGVRGRIVDAAGNPMKEYWIAAQSVGKTLLKEFGQEHIDKRISDENGAFLVQLSQAGDWELSASQAGYANSQPYALTLPLASDAQEIVITLEKEARVSGLVIDHNGRPVPGADVEFATGEPGWMRQVSSSKVPRTKADADGRFTLKGLRGGAIKLFASAKDHAKSLETPVDVGAGEERGGVVLTLRVGGRLTGEVFDGGRPATSMLIQATLTVSADQSAGLTDGNGRFAIEHLEPGAYQIIAISTKARGADEDSGSLDPAAIMSQIKMASAEIVDGQETHVVLGAPPADPVQVHGRVTHGGEPFAGAMVVFAGVSKDLLAGMKTASVAKDGSYSVELDGPGKYSVTVQSFSGQMGEQSSVEFKRIVPAAKDVTIDITMPNARISGRVLGPDGAPAAAVAIGLQSESGVETGSLFTGQFVMKSTDAQGRFDLKAIKPGTYTVVAGGSAFGGALGEEKTFGRATKNHLVVKDGQWIKDVDFRLEKPGVVAVTVVGADDRPVSGASVFARDAEGHVVDALSMLVTGPDGTANYSGLSAGRYTFTARDGDRASSDSGVVEVEAGTSKKVSVTLAGGTVLVVKVVNDKDEPVDVSLVVLDAAGRDVSGMMGFAEMQKRFSSGSTNRDEQRIGPLPAGKYRVRAVNEAGKVIEKPVSLSGQAERKVTLQFDA